MEIALYEDAKRTAMVEHPEVVDKYKGKVPGYLANRYYQMFRTEYIMLNQHDVCDHRPLGSLRFKKTPCVAVKSIAWNRIDDVWHYHVFDKHTGPLAE